MSTKNNPGTFDCFTKAEPDEPMFVLLGRDPTASMIVALWAKLRIELGDDPRSEQIREALEAALALEQWADKLGKGKRIAIARMELASMLREDG